MTKVTQAAKALNDGTIGKPTQGRRVECARMKIAVYTVTPGFFRVFNLTKLGRLGSHIGCLREINGVIEAC